jgi:hypothetical protein
MILRPLFLAGFAALALSATALTAQAETVNVQAKVQIGAGSKHSVKQNADNNFFAGEQSGDGTELNIEQTGKNNWSADRVDGKFSKVKKIQRQR